MAVVMLKEIYAKSLAIVSEESEEIHEQYFTPPEISTFMSAMFAHKRNKKIRLLDAGSGTGILGISASIEAIKQGVSEIHLVCIENEEKSLKLLEENLKQFQRQESVKFTFEILKIDFLEHKMRGDFDGIISNPPYSKISPKIDKGGTSPNLYSRFMEVSSELLDSNGQMVFIIPRSFTNGVYFKKFRKHLFSNLAISQIHLFDSRSNIFKQEILQEIMIVALVKNSNSQTIKISSCVNRDYLSSRKRLIVSRDIVELGEANDYRIAIPITEEDLKLLELFNTWKGRFGDYNIIVSTGPVVAYRSKPHLLMSPKKDNSYPMLWPTHISTEGINWPKPKIPNTKTKNSKKQKEQYISNSASDYIIPNQNYVIMKRFTTKDEAKRLVTCPLRGGSLPGQFLGLENHLNYIHMGEKKMNFTICKGISSMLNSSLFDRYIRIVNGQTQVNATDIANLPIPNIEIISKLGKRKSNAKDYSDLLIKLTSSNRANN